MTNQGVDEEKCKIWGHRDQSKVGAPELLLLALYCIIGDVSELVHPVTVHLGEEVPRQQHSDPQPAADDVDQLVLVSRGRGGHLVSSGNLGHYSLFLFCQ